MQVIYGGEGVSGQRTIRTLDPIIQNEKLYVCVCVYEWKKERGKKKSAYFIAAPSRIHLYLLCVFVHFEIRYRFGHKLCSLWKKKRKEGKKRYFADE